MQIITSYLLVVKMVQHSDTRVDWGGQSDKLKAKRAISRFLQESWKGSKH